MLERELAHRVEIGAEEMGSGCTEGFEIEYYMLKGELGDISEAQEIQEQQYKWAFGIEIIKKNASGTIEKTGYENISCREGSVKELVKKLAVNRVTPVTLSCIMEDYLAG